MKYALTFTNPETYSWSETNTVIIESDINPLDIPLDTLADVLADKSGFGYDKSEWSDILANDSYFVRNVEDTDVVIPKIKKVSDLPTNLILTADPDFRLDESSETFANDINEFLANKYGFCNRGYSYEIRVSNIDWDTED